ncbi:PREDICTED: innexin inx2-like [Ceratosolen solmsi marchali]|uniref:Innexin n=1 Tax=Ceratosolen solmsi marchali TaxID=326594 RepID=A0AAJ6YIB8_9HYME|nr:PREDICTED: innexin inx2-like [Ceratosolen solmsi marchali]XP_011498565.1 PREDICTED: innexin inx2-like [Ceratosolen solmsi marchali]
MLELFAPVKELLCVEPLRIDNLVFRLHSRLTVLLLSVCAILVTAKQLVGEPISCVTDSDGFESEPVNAYCWIYSTFTVKRHLRGIPGREVAAPGVGQALDKDEILHHRYYQWVCIVLALQATTFYAPRALWQVWEGGIVSYLAQDLASPFARDTWTNEHRSRLLSYFSDSLTRGHNIYALRFFACEILNFFNSLSQMYLLNLLLEGQFSRYGPAVMGLTSETKPFERVDPMARLFPKLTKCTIHTFGPGGSSQTHDALCVLPLNVVNEKIFVLLWFWLVFLAGAGALALIYRLMVLTQPWARIILVRASIPGLSRMTAERLVRNLGFGDWFLLRQLTKNANPLVLRQLIHDLTDDYPKVDV